MTHPETLEKKYVSKMSAKALSLMNGMLRMDPEERFSALDALAHPYFEGMREPDIEKMAQAHLLQNRRDTTKSRGSLRAA